MKRFRIVGGVVALWCTATLAATLPGPAAAAPLASTVPHIDPEAMNEALVSNGPGVPLGSAAAYLHYLTGNMLADRGDHAGAIAAYRETLALDESATHVRLRLALEYWRQGQTEEAEAEVRGTVAADPRSAEAHGLLGTFYLQETRVAAAAKELQQAVDLDPKLADSYRALVQADLALNDVHAAERVLDAWATAIPGEGLGWREFGELMLEQGDLPRAEKFLERALKYRPEDPQALAALARLADQGNRPDRAMALFERSQRADPEDPAVLFALGEHHLSRAAAASGASNTTELAAARGCFNSLVAMSSDEGATRVQIAIVYLRAHREADALHELDLALADNPQSMRPRLLKGEIELRQGELADAVSDLSAVPAADEAYLEARASLGLALFNLNRVDEATAALRAGLAVHPDAPELTLELARFQATTGHVADAVELLEAAVASGAESPHRAELVEALANAYEETGRSREAIALLKKSLAGRPGPSLGRLRFALAATLQRSGDSDGAVAAMRELLRFEPRNAEALNFIGYEYAERGIHLSEAQKLVTQALEVEPKNGAFADSLGWVYFRRGKIKRAIETLQRARRFAPEQAAIAAHLGEVYQATGDPGLALESYGQALRILDTHPDAGLAADLKDKLEGLKAHGAASVTSN